MLHFQSSQIFPTVLLQTIVPATLAQFYQEVDSTLSAEPNQPSVAAESPTPQQRIREQEDSRGNANGKRKPHSAD
jgi:SEL1 protein